MTARRAHVRACSEILERVAPESTDGPIEHAKVRCVQRHWWLLPVSMLADAGSTVTAAASVEVVARRR